MSIESKAQAWRDNRDRQHDDATGAEIARDDQLDEIVAEDVVQMMDRHRYGGLVRSRAGIGMVSVAAELVEWNASLDAPDDWIIKVFTSQSNLEAMVRAYCQHYAEIDIEKMAKDDGDE